MSKIFEALEHARRESVTYDEPADDDFINEPAHEFVEPEAAVEPEPFEPNDILDLHREPVEAEAEHVDSFTEEPEPFEPNNILDLHHGPVEAEVEHVDNFTEEPTPEVTYAPTDYRFEVEDAIFALYQRIDAMLPLNTRRIIQFIGPEGEEDVSSIARSFAYVAVKSGKSVLLVEGDQKNHNQKRFFNIKNNVSWMNAADNSKAIPEAIHKIGDIPLYVSTNVDGHLHSQSRALPKAFDAFTRGVGRDYDLIVVDSSPVQKTNDGLLLSPMMDGIVLVVEANKTMGKSAEEIKDRILRGGSKLLGVVVSRERHYLPELLARYVMPLLRR